MPHINEKLAEEKMIVSINDHWIVVIKYVVLLLLSWTIFTLIFITGQWLKINTPIPGNTILITGTLVTTVVSHWLFLQIIQWSLSNWFITTDRVIEFDSKPYIKNDLRFIKISEIHEIEKRKHGLIQNILDYGDVIINVAASPESITFHHVPNPSCFVNLIEEVRLKQKKDQPVLPNQLKIHYGKRYRYL